MIKKIEEMIWQSGAYYDFLRTIGMEMIEKLLRGEIESNDFKVKTGRLDSEVKLMIQQIMGRPFGEDNESRIVFIDELKNRLQV